MGLREMGAAHAGVAFCLILRYESGMVARGDDLVIPRARASGFSASAHVC